MVYSACDHAYYLLYRCGCQDIAFAHFQVSDEARAKSGAGTPRCVTPSCTRAHVEQAGTPSQVADASIGPRGMAAPETPSAWSDASRVSSPQPRTPQMRRRLGPATGQSAETNQKCGSKVTHNHRARSASPRRTSPFPSPKRKATGIITNDLVKHTDQSLQMLHRGTLVFDTVSQEQCDGIKSKTTDGKAVDNAKKVSGSEVAEILGIETIESIEEATQSEVVNGSEIDIGTKDIVNNETSEKVSQSQPCKPCREVSICNRVFQLHKVVGRGAFGVVWRASERTDSGDASPVALKAMDAANHDNFNAAIFEAKLLRLLTLQLPLDSRDRVPKYIVHSASKTSHGGIVHIAMSFIPGFVLDQWLYSITDEEHKRVDVTQIVNGGLPGSRQRSMKLVGAHSFASDLISQLATVFAALEPIAFHRDISAHNVLVDICEEGGTLRPSFALIDFGLAVHSASWYTEWNSSNLAGDPRYWTLAAWMALAFGFRYIETHPNPGFHRQYLARIDHYSLGLLGLEVLFALWAHDCPFDDDKAPGMLEARAAWCAFWDAIFRLFQMFHLRGPQQTQQFLELAPQNIMEHMAELLREVYTTLRAAADHPSNASWAPLLRILADLVDENGSMTWTEIQEILNAKQEVEIGSSASQWAEGRPEPSDEESFSQASILECQRTHDTIVSFPVLPEVVRYNTKPSCRDTGGVCARVRSLSPATPQSTPSSLTQQQRGAQLFSQSSKHAVLFHSHPLVSPQQESYVPPVISDSMERPRSYVPPVATKPTAFVPSRSTGQTLSYMPPPAPHVYVPPTVPGPNYYVSLGRRTSYACH